MNAEAEAQAGVSGGSERSGGWIGKVVLLAYLGAFGWLAYAGYSSYSDANAILRDHGTAEAAVTLVDTSSRTRRGHTSTTYEFRYSFDVWGKTYTGEFSAVNDKADKYLNVDTVGIAYANGDPRQSGVLKTLQRQGSLGDLIKRLAMVGAILGVLALLLGGALASRFGGEKAA